MVETMTPPGVDTGAGISPALPMTRPRVTRPRTYPGVPLDANLTPDVVAVLEWTKQMLAEDSYRHLMIQAYAGSGKSTLLEWVARMARELYPDLSILVVMFNKHNQIEMGGGKGQEGRIPAHRRTTVATCHALGYAALRRYFDVPKLTMDEDDESALPDKVRTICRTLLAERSFVNDPWGLYLRGVGPHPNDRDITVCDNDDWYDLAERLVGLVNMARLTLSVQWTSRGPKVSDYILSQLCRVYPVDDAESEITFPLVEEAVKQSIELVHGTHHWQTRGEVKDAHVVDFVDLLFMPAYDFGIGNKLQRARLILHDEIQDASRAMQEIVRKCVGQYGSWIGVGDENQSIQLFAGADSAGMDRLASRGAYAGLDERGKPKGIFMGVDNKTLNPCWRCPLDHVTEAQKIVPGILPRPGAPKGVIATVEEDAFLDGVKVDDLVLFPYNRVGVRVAYLLFAKGTPFTMRGRLDLSVALLAVVHKIERLSGGRQIQNFTMLLDAWAKKESARYEGKTSNAAANQLASIQDRVGALRFLVEMMAPASVKELKQRIEAVFKEKDDDGVAVPKVTLSTIHRAKGDGKERVWIVAPHLMEPGRFDRTAEQIQQRRNLKYVAYTRSKMFLGMVATDD